MRASPLVSEQERARITSGVRMSLALITMVALIVAGLTGLIFLLVSRVFDSLTPALTHDLEWKARRGAIELSKTAELGLIIGDASIVREAATDYLQSSDVVNVLALREDGSVVFSYGEGIDVIRAAMQKPAGEVHTLDDRLVAWAPAVIEGAEVGRVAVAMSTARLRAGDALREQISLTAALGGAVAMLLALGFVALYIWPVLKLTQRAFERLEHTTEQALEAARLKAQFLANMSHEIRTPMNAIVGLSKLMLNMTLTTKLRRYAEMIDASSRALLGIINDILDFSKLEAGKYQILPSPSELALVVQDVAELLASKAEEKGIDLVYRITPSVPKVVEIDGDRVRQVLMNMMGNAIKFTERGEVYVQADARPLEDGQVAISIIVQDTGPGIAEDLRAHIFEAFSQGDGSLIRKHGGTGLGLTISKEMVRLMGGKIGVESEPGKGSTFSFTVPAKVIDATPAVRGHATSLGKKALVACDNEHARTALREHMAAWGMEASIAASSKDAEGALRGAKADGHPFDVLIVAESQSGQPGGEMVGALRSVDAPLPPIVLLSQARPGAPASVIEVSAQLPQPVRMSALYETVAGLLEPGRVRPANNQQRSTAVHYRSSRVLVVDDNEMNQFVASEQLAIFGCKIDRAFDGQQAVDAVMKNDYDLIFMDCQMPVMDGYTATRTIREREGAGKHNIIVALTAHALEGERARVAAAGMDDYLTKPLRPQMLQRALERWLTGTPVSEQAVVEPEASDLSSNSTALLQLFLEQVPMQLEQLDGAFAMSELDDARAFAHKIKGSLLTVGADELGERAQTIQHAVERGEVEEAEAQLKLLVEGVLELEKRVKSELATRARTRKAEGHA